MQMKANTLTGFGVFRELRVIMKRQLMNLFLIILSFFITNLAFAQNKPFACQSDGHAGLRWESGQWISVSFPPQKFILVQNQDTLTLDSVAKAIDAFPSQVTCKTVKPKISCIDASGGNLFYDLGTMKGVAAQMLGGTLNTTKKDTVSVLVFSCVPF